jgi:hypothetical protein
MQRHGAPPRTFNSRLPARHYAPIDFGDRFRMSRHTVCDILNGHLKFAPRETDYGMG